MDTPTTADEGEPASQLNYPTRFLIILTTVVFLYSCKTKKEKIPVRPSATDTATVQKPKPLSADSLVSRPVVKKKIYLTFDDGPNKGTRNVLQAVKQENIPASFFVVGKHVFDSPEQKATWELLRSDSSIGLCNHSFSHAAGQYTRFYNDPAGVVADINSCQEKLQFSNHVVRMPGRNAWRIGKINVTDIRESRRAIDSVHTAGYDVMGWDIEWSFNHKTLAPDTATDLLLRRIRNLLDAGTTKTPGHLVLLAHDQAFQKDENISKLIAFMRALKTNEDYEFLLAGKYPGLQAATQ